MQINTIIHDRYRILEKLGEGAMGEVFLAEHVNLKRKEALKVLQIGLATEREFVSRFRREARVLNQVQHPNIVGIHDFGQLPDGRYFLSMEYVEGTRVDQLIRKAGAFPMPRALGITVQLCEAVAAAHAQGIVHRDLKPENMMLVERIGQPEILKVLDFGIAKIIAPDAADSVPQTKLGQMFGTPHYMSPQQVLGLPIDTRTDIYSIGCILFEMITGDTPFHGTLIELVLAHRSNAPDRPSLRNPKGKISPQVDAIVLRCLEKAPERRFQTATELADAVRRLPEAPRPGSERGRRPWRATSDFAGPPETDPTSPLHRLAILPTLIGGGDAATDQPDQARADLRAAIAELAEALISRGANNVALIMAVANLKEAAERLARYDTQLDAIDRTINDAVAAARKREGALRMAISDLRFVQQQAHERDDTVHGDIKAQIRELEARLERQSDEHQRELHGLYDRAVEIAAERATMADQIEVIHRALAKQVAELAPRFQADLAIEVLFDRVNAAREHLERLENGPRRGR